MTHAGVREKWIQRRRKCLGYEIALKVTMLSSGKVFCVRHIMPFGLHQRDRTRIISWAQEKMRLEMRRVLETIENE